MKKTQTGKILKNALLAAALATACNALHLALYLLVILGRVNLLNAILKLIK
jgi:hypothetical protein